MSYPRVNFFGRTFGKDAPHFPCRNPVRCPNEPGNLPRPGSDSTLFGIRHEDRLRHFFVVGQTGSGKTSLLYNMSLADIAAGYGVACIDPHGDWASSLVAAIPPSRTRQTIYFDPADLDFPLGLNVFDSVDPDWHFLVADQLISVFRNIWHDSWGPRMEHIFHCAILSLLHVEGSTLLSVPRLLTDKSYRTWITSQLDDDPLLKRFWSHEYEPMSQALQREANSPVLNKVGQFLMSPALRHILGQPRPKLDFSEIMDNSHIFIANLAKGRIGEHNAMLLGSLLVTKFFLAALRRADRPEHERVECFLHIDEVHNLSSDMLATLLSEARKYKLGLTAATQYLEALSPHIRAAVFGNVGSILAFRVGADDARTLAAEFSPHCRADQLQTLGRHEFYVRLAVDGIAMQPFPAVSLPPLTLAYTPQDPQRIIRSSRERYGTRREVIEQKISRWLAHAPGKQQESQAAAKKAFVVT